MYVFYLRSMASGAAFHYAYPRARQQAFLEAHERAFAYFGGVFRRLRYDNLTAAVKKILRGQQREETSRFIAFRSHWRFEASFCTPGQGHENGGTETASTFGEALSSGTRRPIRDMAGDHRLGSAPLKQKS